jgi:N-acetylmuramoyl-L-alanine amidase
MQWPRIALALLAATVGTVAAIESPVLAEDPKAPLVAIDPGHGGPDYGTSGAVDGKRLVEKQLTLEVSKQLAEALKKAGYRVLMTRDADAAVNAKAEDRNGDKKIDTADELQARVDRANEAGAAVLVSIHFNGSVERSLRGPEIYYSPNRPFATENKKLAESIMAAATTRLGEAKHPVTPRGVLRDSILGGHLFVLGPEGGRIVRASKMPGVLVEGMFLTNDEDLKLLNDPVTIQALVRGYADGIVSYLGPPPKAQPARARLIDRANLRPAPLLGARPLATLPVGTTVDLAESVQGDAVGDAAQWWRVDYGGRAGYVFAALLQPIEPAAIPKPASTAPLEPTPAAPKAAPAETNPPKPGHAAPASSGGAGAVASLPGPGLVPETRSPAGPSKPIPAGRAATQPSTTGQVQTDDDLPARIRERPSLEAPVLTRALPNEQLQILEKAEGESVDGGSNNWLKVQRGEIVGWMWAPLLGPGAN